MNRTGQPRLAGVDVEFWFDPICPFSWTASRWLHAVAPERDLHITWKSISLFAKNKPTRDSPFHEPAKRSHGLLRVVEAARSCGHEERIGDLYTEFGRRIHEQATLAFDLGSVLADLDLDPGLATATADNRWDQVIEQSMSDGLGLTGGDVGTPLLAVRTTTGRVGFFGPVIDNVPDRSGALRLWDGFIRIAATPEFYELKRQR